MDDLKLKIALLLKENLTDRELDQAYDYFSISDWTEILSLTSDEDTEHEKVTA